MCGICGIYNFSGEKVDSRILKEMTASLHHRGPDDHGFYINENIGFGHRRLTIIDIHTGKQPIFSEDRQYAIIYNGEIYNYPELRKKLIDRGHKFSTKSDTEVIVHLYEDEGEGCLDYLRGMFSLAIWDNKKKELFFARDRLGKKPFYYYLDSKRFIFASEIKAILKNDISTHLKKDAIIDFFKYQFIPSPRTIYKEIQKLPPGNFGKIGKDSFFIKRYWDIPIKNDLFIDKDLKSVSEELESRLIESTKMRLISDVPLGAFLSGGLDSSLIVSFMKEKSNSEVKTFSIGFKEKSYDESPFSAKVSRIINTAHKKYDVEYKIDEILEFIINQFDEPFGDSSAIPTHYLSKCTKENVKVALSGDGGDELFGGYNRYIAQKLGKKYLKIPSIMRKLGIEKAVNLLPVTPGYYGKNLSKKLKLFINASKQMEKDCYYLPQIFNEKGVNNLFSNNFLEMEEEYDDILYKEFNKAKHFDGLTRLMWLDLHYYLPDDILVKVDRMSMLNSLEVRCPLLDHKVVEYAFNLPLEYKIKKYSTKYILKKIGLRYLPPEIVFRKKQGFMVPLDIWFKSGLKSIFTDKVLHNKIYNRSSIEKINNDHLSGKEDNSAKMWLLLVFSIFEESKRNN